MLNILHVEDDDDIRSLIELAIDFSDDMQLMHVNDGQQGMNYLRHATPDVILLDDQMPNISGKEVMTALKISSRLRRIPVIFLTALSDQSEKSKYFDLGACAVVNKPSILCHCQVSFATPCGITQDRRKSNRDLPQVS